MGKLRYRREQDRLGEPLERKPIPVTALNPVIGHDLGAATARQAYREGWPIREVAHTNSDLDDKEFTRLLDPRGLTEGGIRE